MDNEIEKILNDFNEVLDKQYFETSEDDRNAIARLVLLNEFLSIPMTNSLLSNYKNLLNMKIEESELIENYEAADFHKRILQQINFL